METLPEVHGWTTADIYWYTYTVPSPVIYLDEHKAVSESLDAAKSHSQQENIFKFFATVDNCVTAGLN
jgi:hypothetical protein